MMSSSANVFVAAASLAWMDTGVVLSYGEGLEVTATGLAQWGNRPSYSFPEGCYSNIGFDMTHAYNPAAVLTDGVGASSSDAQADGAASARQTPYDKPSFPVADWQQEVVL